MRHSCRILNSLSANITIFMPRTIYLQSKNASLPYHRLRRLEGSLGAVREASAFEPHDSLKSIPRQTSCRRIVVVGLWSGQHRCRLCRMILFEPHGAVKPIAVDAGIAVSPKRTGDRSSESASSRNVWSNRSAAEKYGPKDGRIAVHGPSASGGKGE